MSKIIMGENDFEAKTIAFFDLKPFLFTFGGTIFTQWFPITSPENVQKLRKIDGLQVDVGRKLVRRVRII